MITFLLDINVLLALSIRNLLPSDVILSSNQITDVYLLGLAAYKGGRLATLDQRIPVKAVTGGQAALELIVS